MNLTPAEEAMDAIEASIDAFNAATAGELWRNTDAQIAALLERAHRAQSRLKAGYLGMVREFDGRDVAKDCDGLNTRAWLRHKLRETGAAAGITLKLAAATGPKGPHAQFGAALAAGDMNPEQVHVAVKAMDKLPADTSLEHQQFSRDLLQSSAAELNADDLRKIGHGLREAADPDGPEPDDRTEIDKVRGVTYRDHHDGTQSITWRDSADAIGQAKAAIGAFDAPKPQPNGGADPRSAPQRRADAMTLIFSAFLRHAADLPAKRGRAPHLHLTCDLDTMKGLTGAAKAALATGGALSQAAVRRLLCESEVTPIVIDRKGKPLSVGRRFRTWTQAIWDALVARDTGCTFPGCDVPAAYCIGHHLRYWGEHDGPTELNNGALVCPRHHIDVHHHGWQVRLDTDGIPEWIPPPWADPQQMPRKNQHWRLQKQLLKPPDLPRQE